MEVGRWEGTPSRVTLKGTDFFSFLCVLMPGQGPVGGGVWAAQMTGCVPGPGSPAEAAQRPEDGAPDSTGGPSCKSERAPPPPAEGPSQAVGHLQSVT